MNQHCVATHSPPPASHAFNKHILVKCLANSYLENILDQAAIFLLLEENQSLAQLPWVTQLNITCLIALIGCKYIQLPSAASWTALFDIHVPYQYLQE